MSGKSDPSRAADSQIASPAPANVTPPWGREAIPSNVGRSYMEVRACVGCSRPPRSVAASSSRSRPASCGSSSRVFMMLSPACWATSGAGIRERGVLARRPWPRLGPRRGPPSGPRWSPRSPGPSAGSSGGPTSSSGRYCCSTSAPSKSCGIPVADADAVLLHPAMRRRCAGGAGRAAHRWPRRPTTAAQYATPERFDFGAVAM